MLIHEFKCAPSVTNVFEATAGLTGRVLLEDVDGGTALIAARPMRILTPGEGTCDPLSALEAALGRARLLPSLCYGVTDEGAVRREPHPPADVPFCGGAIGFFSYDLGRLIESIPSIAEPDVPTPDYCLGLYDSALWIDLTNRRCVAVSRSGDCEAAAFWKRLALAAPESDWPTGAVPPPDTRSLPSLRGNFTKAEYLHAIRRIRDYIAAGDVYQVNLSQRFEAEIACSPWELYKALRRINPAPKSCYMEMDGPVLASASPEIFLTFDPATRIARTKPIKGTRPRGADPSSDARLESELAASEKDRAENLMIVDMERNDLGRVADYGSVRVPELWAIEKHPNVFQMVSTVECRVAERFGLADILRATFPGGSITGAPKIRAMEIIEELEPHRRGIYTGSAGFIDFEGRIDLSIVIRSFVIHQNTAYFHAGGGIVIDSEPEMEYQETLDKISGLRAALWECGGKR